jgi:diacylglycerol kinase (ATP)
VRHAVVLANPMAAAVTPDVVTAVGGLLAGSGYTVETHLTEHPGHAVELVRAACADPRPATVVVLGGDGTVREAAEGIARGRGRWPGRGAAAASPVPSTLDGTVLLALPVGSGNSVCRNVWGDLEWPDVLAAALGPSARVRHLDLMRLVEPDLGVLLGASSGFLAEVLIRARTVTGQHGRARYYTAAAGVLAAMPDHPTRVVVDGVVVHDGPASVAAVGGGRYRAHAFQFLPESVLDDGLLDVCTIGPLVGLAASELVPLMPDGKHLAVPGVGYARGRQVRIERLDGPLVAEFDGEVWDRAGAVLTVDVVPGAVPMLAPLHAPAG